MQKFEQDIKIEKILTRARMSIEKILGKKVHIIVVDDLRNNNTILAKITTVISDYYSVPVESIMSKNREACVSLARQVCMYIAFAKYRISKNQIAKYYDRNHSTVIYAITQIKNMMDIYPSIKMQVMECLDFLKK